MEEAIIGTVERCGTPPCFLIDENKYLEYLIEDGMSYEEATEFFEFNIKGYFLGESTPFFKIDDENIEQDF